MLEVNFKFEEMAVESVFEGLFSTMEQPLFKIILAQKDVQVLRMEVLTQPVW